jgi:mannose-6-phosphate isomerase-like protein (cupin superfamily)
MALKAGDTLDLGPLGFTLLVRKAAAETGGDAFETEMVIAPHSAGMSIHLHPSAIETYDVLAGTVDIYIDGAWKSVATGHRVGVPRGMPHAFRNSSSEPARVYNAHKPALRYEEYFQGLWRIVQSGLIIPGHKTWQAMLATSALMTAYPEEIRSVSPPGFVVQALGTFGQWLGYGP